MNELGVDPLSRVKAKIADLKGYDKDSIDKKHKLSQIIFRQKDCKEVAKWLREKFWATRVDPEKWETVGDIVDSFPSVMSASDTGVEQLQPCPNPRCYGSRIEARTGRVFGPGEDKWCVMCESCCVSSHICDSRSSAIEGWNRISWLERNPQTDL